MLTFLSLRLTEEILHESIDARTEVLAALRELGPPDLVQLIKQAPRNPGKQVRGRLRSGAWRRAKLSADWSLSPCHRSRCFIFCKLGSIHQYPYLQRKPPIKLENRRGRVLVCHSTREVLLRANWCQLLQCLLQTRYARTRYNSWKRRQLLHR
jgi:hypothetical protein